MENGKLTWWGWALLAILVVAIIYRYRVKDPAKRESLAKRLASAVDYVVGGNGEFPYADDPGSASLGFTEGPDGFTALAGDCGCAAKGPCA